MPIPEPTGVDVEALRRLDAPVEPADIRPGDVVLVRCIAEHDPAGDRDIVRVVLFAFNGRRRLFAHSIVSAPALLSSAERASRLEAALRAIGRLARSDGNRTFDDTIRDLGLIDDLCRGASK